MMVVLCNIPTIHHYEEIPTREDETMKFKYGDIVYFKPAYYPELPGRFLMQIIRFDANSDAYLAVRFDEYYPIAPDHFWRTYVEEEDIGFISEIDSNSGYADNEIIFKDDIDLVRNSRLTDVYKNTELIRNYKFHKDEYPDIFEYIKAFEKKD